MVYITYPAPNKFHQITFEEMMSGNVNTDKLRILGGHNTLTLHLNDVPANLKGQTSVRKMIADLQYFVGVYYDTLMPQIKEFEKLSDAQRRSVKQRDKIENYFEQMGATANDEDLQKITEQVDALQCEVAEQQYKYAYYTFDLRKSSAPEHIPLWRLPKEYRRTINAPNIHLKNALYELKELFENMMIRTYHTASFAYVKHRGTLDAVKRHQSWESKWFAKFDFSDFFGSTTIDFVMQQFSQIYPFNMICAYKDGKEALYKALQLCFLDGGLPQGTPISPLITNIMMIPFDHAMSKALKEFKYPNKHGSERFVYTRYADDLLISCRVDFKVEIIQAFILETLKSMNAPFSLNVKKTRYGSSAGSNWNLGVMLNKDNKITIGAENKRRLKASLNSFILDMKNEKPWDISMVYRLRGQISYYRNVEREATNNIIAAMNTKYGVDAEAMMKAIIS